MKEFTLHQDVNVSREQLQQQIKQTVREAQVAAEQAAKAAADQARNEGRPSIVIAPGAPGIPTTGVSINPENMIPPQAVTISIGFFVMIAAIIIGLPLMRAIARRIDRGTQQPQIPAEVREQLRQINQSVDAIAIEVERISENQRFTTKLLADRTTEKQPG